MQDTLEAAVLAVTGERLRVKASSRTDAGVHAAALPVLLRTQSPIPQHGLIRAMNSALPPDCSVIAATGVDDDFDVRTSASGKIYRYRVWNDRPRSALRTRTHWHVPVRLDLEAMRRAALALIGEHDFSAFRASGCQSKSPVRRLTRIAIEGEAGGEVLFELHGNAFLQNMVRILVGTLTEIGRGYRAESSTAEILASRDRRLAGQTAPGHGLTLEHVAYDLPLRWVCG